MLRILDLGAGTGTAKVIYDAQAQKEIVTVDLNPDLNPDVLCDVRELPDSIGMFDVIYASHILEHLGIREAAPTLKHWREHLKPGGMLCVIVPDLNWLANKIFMEEGNYALYMAVLYGNAETDLQTHKSSYTIELLRRIVVDAGYVVQEASLSPFQIGLTSAEGTEAVTAMQIVLMAHRPKENEA